MKKHFLPIIIFLLLSSCTQEDKPRSVLTEHSDSIVLPKKPTEIFPDLILYEDSLNSIGLPLEKQEMLGLLKERLKPYTVKKEIGQQDGPDFPLYSVIKNKEELLFFAMNSEDTLHLDELYIKSPLVTDIYGLRVGDDYDSIIKKRKRNFKQYTNHHHHTYLYQDNSNISYEISGNGNESLPGDEDLENIQFTEAVLKNWKIEYVIWRNK
ncbi:MAG: hypothetical protein JWM14_3394 [Chitinophagaceae bacterium]|nr:hypothetical protein [Chitinophagaceae bacterium]